MHLAHADLKDSIVLLAEIACKFGVLEASKFVTEFRFLYNNDLPKNGGKLRKEPITRIADKLRESLSRGLLGDAELTADLKLTQAARNFLEDVGQQTFVANRLGLNPGTVLSNMVETFASAPGQSQEPNPQAVLAEHAVRCLASLMGESLNIEAPLVNLIRRIWKTDPKLKDTFSNTMTSKVFPRLGNLWQTLKNRNISEETFRKTIANMDETVELMYMGARAKARMADDVAKELCNGKEEEEIKELLMNDLLRLKDEWCSAKEVNICLCTVSSWCAQFRTGSSQVHVESGVKLGIFKKELQRACGALGLHPWQVVLLKPILEDELRHPCREPSWLLKWHLHHLPPGAGGDLATFLDLILFSEKSAEDLGGEIYMATHDLNGFNAHRESSKLQAFMDRAEDALRTELRLGDLPSDIEVQDSLPKLKDFCANQDTGTEGEDSVTHFLENIRVSCMKWKQGLRLADAQILQDLLSDLMLLLRQLQLEHVAEELGNLFAFGVDVVWSCCGVVMKISDLAMYRFLFEAPPFV